MREHEHMRVYLRSQEGRRDVITSNDMAARRTTWRLCVVCVCAGEKDENDNVFGPFWLGLASVTTITHDEAKNVVPCVF